ncbi:hypothetical protein LguiA_028366 [Lonicera macranthoides]
MSNSMNPRNETLEEAEEDNQEQQPLYHQTPPPPPINNYNSGTGEGEAEAGGEEEEWETMARDWLSTVPEGKAVTPIDMEAWLQSNHASLPPHLFSMPRPQLYERFTSIRNSLAPSSYYQEKDANQVDHSQARFQRTDQWLPVYTWLESLDTEEVIKSQDVLDWLTENPEVKEDLYSRHSRYHLMHYIKKCHVKILKRKERKKGMPIVNKTNSVKVHKTGGTKLVPLQCSNMNNLPTDSEMYMAKRNEAFRKYEILVEMEEQLSTLFAKREEVKYLTES